VKFPPFFTSFTIPNGAGPNTSRLVLLSNGALISYDIPGKRYVELFGGTLYLGPLNADNSVDGSHEATVVYEAGNPPGLFINSPISSTFPQGLEIQIQPGNGSTINPRINILATPSDADLFVFGDITGNNITANNNLTAGNIAVGTLTITSTAGAWVATGPIGFGRTFTNVPKVFIMEQNGGPSGTSQLMYCVTSVTTSTFFINVFRTTTLATLFSWLAIDM
jgi:hypothetical protein